MPTQRKNKLVHVIATAVVLSIVAFTGCTAILGDFEISSGVDAGTTDGAVGKAEGTTCGAANECASGNCVDGVCCESACAGECETCNLPNTLGKCMPVPDGEDPQNECATTPLLRLFAT